MMSAMNRIHYRYRISVLAFTCSCIALMPQTNAAQDITSLASELSAKEYFLGEPVDLMVQLRWHNPEPGSALVTSQSFLEIEVRTHSGEALTTPSDWHKISHDFENNALNDQTIILTKDHPIWSAHIQLNRRFRFDSPNKLSVRVAWTTPPKESLQLDAKLIEKVPADMTARILNEVHAPDTAKSFVVRCPATPVDRAAFEQLSGGSCPMAMPALDSAYWSTARLQEVLERFPDSVYAGYALSRGAGAMRYPARHGESLVYMLGSGRFLREHPTVTLVLDPPRAEGDKLIRTEAVQTEDRIRQHLSQVSRFVHLHPAFVLRERLEMMMGFDSLALGQPEQAASHWRWVRENGYDERLVKRAEANLVELEQYDLGSTEQ